MEALKKEDIDSMVSRICEKLNGKVINDCPQSEAFLLSKSLYVSKGITIEFLEQDTIFELVKSLPIGENNKVLNIYSYGIEKNHIEFVGTFFNLYLRAEWV